MMFVSGTTPRWCQSLGLLAVGLGAALLLPTAACAQTAEIQAQKERELAATRAKLDGLLKEAAGNPIVIEVAGDDGARTEVLQLKAKLTDAMKARAAAEFSGYAQEVEKERAVAQLKRLDAIQFTQAQPAEREKAEMELPQAQAVIQQKMAEVRELEAKIRALAEKMKAAEATAARTAAQVGQAQNRFQVVSDKADEIVLRKVDGKWEIVAPKTARAVEAPKAVTLELKSKADQPRIAVMPGAAPAGKKDVEFRFDFGQPPPTAKPATPASIGSRLDELEKKMDKVMQQLEQIRREMNRGRSGAGLNPEGSPDRARIILNDVELIRP
jgi:hypothetical protein